MFVLLIVCDVKMLSIRLVINHTHIHSCTSTFSSRSRTVSHITSPGNVKRLCFVCLCVSSCEDLCFGLKYIAGAWPESELHGCWSVEHIMTQTGR